MSIHKVIIIRHSERMDEVDSRGWKSIVQEDKSSRNKYYLLDDPPITENGKNIAKTATLTLSTVLDREPTKVNKIYSSRLRRCVETAYFIALSIGVPIYICKGLSLTAAAVAVDSLRFEFHSIAEIQSFCPGVLVVDCDDASNESFITSNNWLETLEFISSKNTLSVIVAHRETIRNLVPTIGRIPYCAITCFNYCPPSTKSDLQSIKAVITDLVPSFARKNRTSELIKSKFQLIGYGDMIGGEQDDDDGEEESVHSM